MIIDNGQKLKADIPVQKIIITRLRRKAEFRRISITQKKKPVPYFQG